MNVEIAENADIISLTELRLAYLKEDYGELSEDDITKIRQELPSYFEKNLNKNLFCYLVRENQEAVACAFLLVIEKPMSPAFITGKTGTVLNVYTKPKYRRRGYAKKIVERLLSDARVKNLSTVELKATDDGYELYRSAGFTEEASKYHSMKWHNR